MKLKKLHIFLLFLAVLVFGSLSSGFIEGLENKDGASKSDKSNKRKSQTADDESYLDETGGNVGNYETILANEQLTNPATPSYTTAVSGDGPEGVPATSIPPGDEHLYILKSEIVPPVCPACPSSESCPREKPCRPCPPCARCPEPAFECKKVPNYRAGNSDYLPKPVLNDFGQFGM